jgi:hypothetical protein
MRALVSAAAAFVFAAVVLLSSGGHVALASFHCMRIHAVIGGLAGNSSIQYVELRMNAGGQSLVAGHTLEFRDGSGTLKATFTFPSNVSNALTGDSILIATSEFNAVAIGGMADYTFSMANTVGANGGDPLHPVQGTNGSVIWVPVGSPGASGNCALQSPVDSVAYGTATATYGTAAAALPSPGTTQALRLNNLALNVTNNHTEYDLQSVSTSTFAVAPANLASDRTTPRNNGRTVIKLTTASSVGGVAQAPDLPAGVAPEAASARGAGYMPYAALGGGLALLVAGGVGWYAYRRRAPPGA